MGEPQLSPEDDWIPDLFADLYDDIVAQASSVFSTGLSQEVFGFGELDPLLTALRACEAGAVPSDVRSYLSELLPIAFGKMPARSELARKLVVAVAIDHVIGEIQGPSFGWVPRTLPSGLALIREHALGHKRGSYLSHAAGLLIPKRARPEVPSATPAAVAALPEPPPIGSGDCLDGLFHNVLRVLWPAGSGCTLHYARIPRRDDFEPDALRAAAAGAPIPRVRVAVVPWAEHADALEFAGVWQGTAPLLRTLVAHADPAAVHAGAHSLVARLAADSVQVAVLPELVVTPDAVRALRGALRAHAAADASSSLRLVVAGTGLSDGPAPGTKLHYNESVVLSATGKVLWRQRKLHHYAMATDAMDRYGLGHCVLKKGVDHREEIHTHNVVCVRDGSLGRMLVLICEDLAQPEPSQRVLATLRPDWLFVPVLDGQLETGRWIHQRAWPIGSLFGTNTVVATSMVLALRKEATLTEVGVGLCVPGHTPRRHRLLAVRCGDDRPLIACVDWLEPDVPPSVAQSDGWVEGWIVAQSGPAS